MKTKDRQEKLAQQGRRLQELSKRLADETLAAAEKEKLKDRMEAIRRDQQLLLAQKWTWDVV